METRQNACVFVHDWVPTCAYHQFADEKLTETAVDQISTSNWTSSLRLCNRFQPEGKLFDSKRRLKYLPSCFEQQI